MLFNNNIKNLCVQNKQFALFCFEKGSHYVTQAALKLSVLLLNLLSTGITTVFKDIFSIKFGVIHRHRLYIYRGMFCTLAGDPHVIAEFTPPPLVGSCMKDVNSGEN